MGLALMPSCCAKCSRLFGSRQAEQSSGFKPTVTGKLKEYTAGDIGGSIGSGAGLHGAMQTGTLVRRIALVTIDEDEIPVNEAQSSPHA
jgi:hypothetical protein